MAQPLEPESIDRNYARLLMLMQRLVREEFNIRVPLADADAASHLLSYANKSQNRELVEVRNELLEMLEPAVACSGAEAEQAARTRANYYRGVARDPGLKESDTQAITPRKRIYRGCQVGG